MEFITVTTGKFIFARTLRLQETNKKHMGLEPNELCTHYLSMR